MRRSDRQDVPPDAKRLEPPKSLRLTRSGLFPYKFGGGAKSWECHGDFLFVKWAWDSLEPVWPPRLWPAKETEKEAGRSDPRCESRSTRTGAGRLRSASPLLVPESGPELKEIAAARGSMPSSSGPTPTSSISRGASGSAGNGRPGSSFPSRRRTRSTGIPRASTGTSSPPGGVRKTIPISAIRTPKVDSRTRERWPRAERSTSSPGCWKA